MVITPEYAVGHIPRTAGDSALAMMMNMAFEDDPESYRSGSQFFHRDWKVTTMDRHEKHNTFDQDGASDKKLILGIRRLPAYMMSISRLIQTAGIPPVTGRYRNIEVEHQINPKAEYDNKFVNHYGPIALIPDYFMKKFLRDGELEVYKWIRVETLREDMLEVAHLLMREPPSEDLKEKILRGATKRPEAYDHDWTKRFTEEQVERMYENNPFWAQCELEAYGEPLEYKYEPIDYVRTVGQ